MGGGIAVARKLLGGEIRSGRLEIAVVEGM